MTVHDANQLAGCRKAGFIIRQAQTISFIAVLLSTTLLLTGCGVLDRGFLSPAGPIATAIRDEFLRVCLICCSWSGRC